MVVYLIPWTAPYLVIWRYIPILSHSAVIQDIFSAVPLYESASLMEHGMVMWQLAKVKFPKCFDPQILLNVIRPHMRKRFCLSQVVINIYFLNWRWLGFFPRRKAFFGQTLWKYSRNCFSIVFSVYWSCTATIFEEADRLVINGTLFLCFWWNLSFQSELKLFTQCRQIATPCPLNVPAAVEDT